MRGGGTTPIAGTAALLVRATPMIRVLVLAFVLALAACGKTSNRPPPLVWHSLAEGEALARREHKLALVFFGADWSVADMRLERETFPSSEVRNELRDWVAIKVDMTDEEVPGRDEITNRFRMAGVPTVLAYDFENDVELCRYSELVSPATMAAALREVKARPRRGAAR